MAVFDDPEMQEIFEGFLVEANEILESISTDLVDIEKNPHDLDLINKLFRSFHTIKGTASFMGFSDVAEITHHAEDILNKLRKEELNITQEIIDVLLEVQDWIVMLIDKVKDQDDSAVDYSDVIARIEILKTGKSLAEGSDSSDSKANEAGEQVPSPSSDGGEHNVETNERAVDAVLANPALVTGADAWTEDEVKLIDTAFSEVNADFWQEQGKSDATDTATASESITATEEGGTTESETIKDDSSSADVSSVSTEGEITDESVATSSDEIPSESIDTTSDGIEAISDIATSDSEDLLAQNQELEDNLSVYNDEETDVDTEGNQINDQENVSQESIPPKHEPEPVKQQTVVEHPVQEVKATPPPPPQVVPQQPAEKPSVVAAKTAAKPTTAITKPTSGAKAPVADTTIRVDVGRVEAILDLSGELVLNRNRLTQISEYLASDITFETFKAGVKDLVETAESIDSITSEIQGAAMKMRMVPVGKLYQKAPRIVRDLSKEFNKKINLVVKGEETEIDRGIIEELTDPLTHMIRNSCDHGIEMPEVRITKGKPETGTITLDAEQEGNNIVLKISDDGAGMDAEFLKSKAIEKGVITYEQAASMTQRDAYQLIFAPGFSTAAKVTSVSGRGVGMDVVKTNIAELKGFVDIETEVGKGTTFFVKLPLTLAIIQGLIVNAGGEKFAIPLNSVLNVVSVETDNIYTLNQVEVIRIREDVIPLIRLDLALDTPKKKNNISDCYVVIVGVGSQSIGIVVDDLLGQQEVVIKSLGEYLGTINAISGSTIMGDGSVIMIVDVAMLVQSVYDAKHHKQQQDLRHELVS